MRTTLSAHAAINTLNLTYQFRFTDIYSDMFRRFLVNATKEDYTEKRILFLIETAH